MLLKGRDRVFPLESVEQALGALRDVRSAKIVADDVGRILAVHVVSSSERSAKQIARDVESVLVAKLGIAIDHRKISIAQVGAESPAPAAAGEARSGTGAAAGGAARGGRTDAEPEQPVPRGLAAKDRRIEFVGVSVAQSQNRAEARVELAIGDVVSAAAVDGADASASVLRIVADATLRAVQQFFEGGGLFVVAAVEQATVGGKPVIVVDVSHLAERQEKTLLGACPVNGGDLPRATALATLDAVNRFLRRLTPKEPEELIVGPALES